MIHTPPKLLQDALERQGWSPAYRDDEVLLKCEQALASSFRLNSMWSEAVARFGGYRLRWNGSTDARMGAAVILDPLCWRNMSTDFDEYSALVGESVLPLGVVDVQEMPLGIGVSGAGYFFGPNIQRWGRYLDAIEDLVFGLSHGEIIHEP